MKELFFHLGLIIWGLQGYRLIMNAKQENVCGCIVNATIMICLIVALTR